MMKNYFLVTALIIGAVFKLSGQEFKALLSGNHEPFPVLSAASGNVTATLIGDTLTVTGQISGITSGVDTSIAGGAHIHSAYAGQNGDAISVLKPTLSDGLVEGTFEAASNTIILDEEMKSALSERRLYVNVHSGDYSGGEIRGQLVPAEATIYTANLFGSNASIPVMSEANGSVILEVVGDSMVVSGSFSNLSSPLAIATRGGIHIHAGKAGTNGGIVQDLNVELSDDNLSAVIPAAANTFAITEEMKMDLQADGWYVNVHSLNFGGGEIRGQLTPEATSKLRANLTGTNQTPPVTSYAHGRVVASYTDGSLRISGSFSGLESDINTAILGGAHIHMAMAGSNGAVVYPLLMDIGDDNRSAIIDPDANTFPISGDTLSALMARGLYVNVHSLNNGSGEIRGQLASESQYYLNGFLSASQQAAGVVSNSSGAVLVEVLGDKITASGSFNNLSAPLAIDIAGGTHIHFAPAGSNGPVRFVLGSSPTNFSTGGVFNAADNTFELAEGQKDTLRGRWGYVNVHTENYTGGELRSQLLPEAVAYFYTPLSGAEENPPVITGAKGAAIMEYTGTNAIITGSFSQLGSAFSASHLHFGMAGSNGGVLTPLSVSGDDSSAGVYLAGDNNYPVTEGWMDTVRNRMMYVNVHSSENAGGEIRGNLRPTVQNLYVANLSGKSAGLSSGAGRGTILIEQNGSNFVSTGSFNGLVGDFDKSIAGGAHVHSGAVGQGGGILFALNSIASDDLKGAQFLADSNTMVVADSILPGIELGESYVNIHSTTAPGGEIRGQVLSEINYAPTSTGFILPAEDTLILGDEISGPFVVEWQTSLDPNNNLVNYTWELSGTSGFDSVMVTVNTDATSYETTYEVLDSLFGLSDLDSSAVATIYHRVSASDGSLCSDLISDSIVVGKGIVTSLKENPYFENLFTLYPSPTKDQVQLSIDMKQASEAVVYIVDMTGKVMYQQRATLAAGLNVVQRNVSQLRAGTYVAQIVINNKITAARQFSKL